MKTRAKKNLKILGGVSLSALFIGAAGAGAFAPAASAQTSGTESGIVTSLTSLDQPVCGMVSGQLSDGFNFITGGDFAGMLRYDKEKQIPVQLTYNVTQMPAACAAFPGADIKPGTQNVSLNVVIGISAPKTA